MDITIYTNVIISTIARQMQNQDSWDWRIKGIYGMNYLGRMCKFYEGIRQPWRWLPLEGTVGLDYVKSCRQKI